MARGGFHGGGFHSGGHHGGGGFRSSGGGGFRSSGGGFRSSGSGFHMSSSHSSGYRSSSHYSGGGYGGYGLEDEGDFFGIFRTMGIISVLIVGFFTLFIIRSVAEGMVPGYNLLNLGIFFASFVILIVSLIKYDQTSDLETIRYANPERFVGKIWNLSKNTPATRNGTKFCWVSKDDKQFYISFYDREYGPENIKKVVETMNRTPKILWIRQPKLVWALIGCVVVNFFFYELVIPVFENMIMTDIAFMIIDEVVFYFMSVNALLIAVGSLIITKFKVKILYECAVRIVADNGAAEKRLVTESFINSKLGEKWYYNSCPNCGAVASKALRTCLTCGSSLEVISYEKGDLTSVRKISVGAEKNASAGKNEEKAK